MKWLQTVFLVVFTFGSLVSLASFNKETLYINRGVFQASDGVTFPYLAFNSTPIFSQQNVIINTNVGDTLQIEIINNDSIEHQFEIIQTISSGVIAGGDTTLIEYVFTSEAVHIYRDPSNYPNQTYLGLAGMIAVSNSSYSSFYWNIKEHQKSVNDSINSIGTYNWLNYYPDYFTLNGRSAPFINQDPLARITGSVQETILIYLTNTGQSAHSIHFHGYHLEIIYSSKFPNHPGRSKDTFAILPQEGLILKLVPDKPGEFPVHDHNLIAVSGGGMYPIGRFLTMLIQ